MITAQEKLEFARNAYDNLSQISGESCFCATHSTSSFLMERLAKETDLTKPYVGRIIDMIEHTYCIRLEAEHLKCIASTHTDFHFRQKFLRGALIDWLA